MAYYVIDNTCIMCGRCTEECPLDAISKGDGKYVINDDDCCGCGSCERVCPMEAIKEV